MKILLKFLTLVVILLQFLTLISGNIVAVFVIILNLLTPKEERKLRLYRPAVLACCFTVTKFFCLLVLLLLTSREFCCYSVSRNKAVQLLESCVGSYLSTGVVAAVGSDPNNYRREHPTKNFKVRTKSTSPVL